MTEIPTEIPPLLYEAPFTITVSMSKLKKRYKERNPQKVLAKLDAYMSKLEWRYERSFYNRLNGKVTMHFLFAEYVPQTLEEAESCKLLNEQDRKVAYQIFDKIINS